MAKKGTARGKRPARVRDGVGSRVIYCENCGSTGQHIRVSEVRMCYGRGVADGRDFQWVSA